MNFQLGKNECTDQVANWAASRLHTPFRCRHEHRMAWLLGYGCFRCEWVAKDQMCTIRDQWSRSIRISYLSRRGKTWFYHLRCRHLMYGTCSQLRDRLRRWNRLLIDYASRQAVENSRMNDLPSLVTVLDDSEIEFVSWTRDLHFRFLMTDVRHISRIYRDHLITSAQTTCMSGRVRVDLGEKNISIISRKKVRILSPSSESIHTSWIDNGIEKSLPPKHRRRQRSTKKKKSLPRTLQTKTPGSISGITFEMNCPRRTHIRQARNRSKTVNIPSSWYLSSALSLSLPLRLLHKRARIRTRIEATPRFDIDRQRGKAS